MARMTITPYEILLYKMGIKSKRYKKLNEDWIFTIDYGMKKILELQQKKGSRDFNCFRREFLLESSNGMVEDE
jgi:hypothetical protein